MGFKPVNADSVRNSGDFDFGPVPVPKAGSRPARISLIVDLGIQKREPFVDQKTKEEKPQNPAQQVAVFVDLVSDVVDYGGKIGKQQYRLPVNDNFKGEYRGINFQAVLPRDADGKIIKGEDPCLHPTSPLTKLAKATGKVDVIKSLDISELLDQPFMCSVEVKETPHKEGKKDKDGKLIVYKNVNFKGATTVPMLPVMGEDGEPVMDADGNPKEVPMKIAKLNQAPLCVTFTNAKKEDIQFIRPALIKKIKLAENYAGSQMQKAIEAWEAENGGPKEESKPAEKPAALPKAAPAGAPVGDDEFEDTPF